MIVIKILMRVSKSKNEIRDLIEKNIEICSDNPRRVKTKFITKTTVYGFFWGDKFWLQYAYPMSGYLIRQFDGEISGEENSCLIDGEFKLFFLLPIAYYTFISLFSTAVIYGFLTEPSMFELAGTIGILFAAFWKRIFLKYLKRELSHGEKALIIFLENLLGTVAEYSE